MNVLKRGDGLQRCLAHTSSRRHRVMAGHGSKAWEGAAGFTLVEGLLSRLLLSVMGASKGSLGPPWLAESRLVV